jgi:hypothetical protein
MIMTGHYTVQKAALSPQSFVLPSFLSPRASFPFLSASSRSVPFPGPLLSLLSGFVFRQQAAGAADAAEESNPTQRAKESHKKGLFLISAIHNQTLHMHSTLEETTFLPQPGPK